MVSIGTFPEEDTAYDLVSKLFWILPTVIFTAGLMDAFLVGIYMRFAHPWKDIPFGAENPKKVSNPAEKSQKISNPTNGTTELQEVVAVSESEKSQNVSGKSQNVSEKSQNVSGKRQNVYGENQNVSGKSQTVSENNNTELQEVTEVSNSAQPNTDAGKISI